MYVELRLGMGMGSVAGRELFLNRPSARLMISC